MSAVPVDRFLAALPRRVNPVAAAGLGADLLSRWSEPHRSYHNVRHLETVLSIVDANGRFVRDLTAVRLAAWFHDAVYDPTAPGGANEEASALLAGTELAALRVDADLIGVVCRLVRMTAGHRPAPDDPEGCLLADADLAILAAEPDDYDGYRAAVRREYGHVPDPLYRLGRSQVLNHLLGLPDLYRVVPARAEWTVRAHDNLRRELADLAVDGGD